MMPVSPTLRTPRMLLRPTRPDDARSAFEIQSNWNVSRMLARAAFPSDEREISAWFRGHAEEWANGSACRFAAILDGAFIGIADVDAMSDGEGSLGYWLSEAVWGRGLAREASRAVVRFAFDTAGLVRLRAGHADDNPRSGKVLSSLGFRYVGDRPLWYRSRGTTVMHRRYVLARG